MSVVRPTRSRPALAPPSRRLGPSRPRVSSPPRSATSMAGALGLAIPEFVVSLLDDDISNFQLAQIRWKVSEMAVLSGRPLPSGEVVTEQMMDAICDRWRPLVNFAVRPANHMLLPANSLELRAQEQPEVPPQPESPFTWAYWDLPVPWTDASGGVTRSFPFAVAVLKKPWGIPGAEGRPALTTKYIMAAHSLISLLPTKAKDYSIFNPTSDAGAFFASLGVAKEEAIPSNRALGWIKRNTPDYVHPSGLTFNYYECTPRMFLAVLAYYAKNPSQKDAALAATRDILHAVFRLPGDDFNMAGIPVAGGKAGAIYVRQRLEMLGLARGWDAKWRTIRMPSLRDDDANIPAGDIVFFLFRHITHSHATHDYGRTLVQVLAAWMESRLGAVLTTDIPACRLPAEAEIAARSIRRALRDDDKRFHLYNCPSFFLRKNQGLAANRAVDLLQQFIHSPNQFSAYRNTASEGLASAYLHKARVLVRDMCLAATTFAGDTVVHDCSRGAKKERCPVHLYIEDTVIAAPLQNITDQPRLMEPDAARDTAMAIASRRKAAKKTVRLESTKNLGLAIVHAMLAILPWANVGVYKPTALNVPFPGAETVWSAAQGAWYYWDPVFKTAVWALPDEIRRWQHHLVRIWTLVSDEGSQGWAFFLFLANFVGLRVLFLRDPFHRLSNLYTNGLKFEKNTHYAALRSVVVARYRRAPFGSAKFWNALRDTLVIFLACATEHHPLVGVFGPAIARDHGLPQTYSWAQLVHAMRRMLADSIGPSVELRRWWSVFDSVVDLLIVWHTFLLALVLQYAMDGSNAFAEVQKVEVVMRKDDDKEVKRWKFKQQVLATLFDNTVRRLLVSMTLVYRRIREHHRQIARTSLDAVEGLLNLQFWADRDAWISRMVIPTFAAAMSGTAFRELGIFSDIDEASAPLLEVSKDAGEDAYIFVAHIRNLMSCIRQLLRYIVMTTTPPWCYVRALKFPKNTSFMRDISSFIGRLFRSHSPRDQNLLGFMPFLRWPTVLEPLAMYEAGKFDPESPWIPAALQYIKTGFDKHQNSFDVENLFCAWRDNELRGAKHHQRSDTTLQSLQISNVATRFRQEDELSKKFRGQLIEISEADSCANTSRHVSPDVFKAEKMSVDSEKVGFKHTDITDPRVEWDSTTPSLFCAGPMSLYQVMFHNDHELWGKLELARLLSPGHGDPQGRRRWACHGAYVLRHRL